MTKSPPSTLNNLLVSNQKLEHHTRVILATKDSLALRWFFDVLLTIFIAFVLPSLIRQSLPCYLFLYWRKN